MIIVVDGRVAGTPVTLSDASTFTELKLVAYSAAGDGSGVQDAIESLGRWEGTHAFIAPEDIRALAGDVALNGEWRTGFDGMIAYADGAGWVDADGAVRVHIEHAE